MLSAEALENGVAYYTGFERPDKGLGFMMTFDTHTHIAAVYTNILISHLHIARRQEGSANAFVSAHSR